MEQIIVTDRSRIEAYFDCPRKRYFLNEFAGWGVVPDGPPPEDLAYGIGFHAGAEVLCLGGELSEALDALGKETRLIEGVTPDGLPKSQEFFALGYGHLRSLKEFIIPRIKSQYDIIAVETEIAFPLSERVLDLNRIDVAFRDRDTKRNYLVEWKTDSNPSDIDRRMEFNLQFVLGCACLEKVLGEVVSGSIIIGADKGSKRWVTDGEKEEGLSGYRRDSPFTYAYAKEASFGGLDWRLKWTKYWKKTPIWREMPLEAWWGKLQLINPDLAREQFTITNPIPWDREAYERTRQQVVAVEERIALGGRSILHSDTDTEVKESILNEFFPMNRKNCRNDGGYKKECPFVEMCHFRQDASPLDLGFKWREANHPLEETLRRRPE